MLAAWSFHASPHTELANLCGLTRERTNKWLRFCVREGLLSYEGGRITLVHPDRLGRETP
ncbi:helix-turn-helix domain-containing protein [Myxococcus sp. AM011]|uniref:helix-turn-helix domain-containing protein n=1 Tax=Myxococcus sp. AM011 TaxID=2745200 RepID=UPI0020CE124D|nr:helix-turn-helix domain-containing protein [Myxococcus sp. AM011]